MNRTNETAMSPTALVITDVGFLFLIEFRCEPGVTAMRPLPVFGDYGTPDRPPPVPTR